MVGTASSTVTRSRRIRSIALAGSKRANSESPAPAAIAAFIAQVIPNTWNSGKQASTTSSSVSFTRRRTMTSWFEPRLPWVSSAPFGVPVVPEVCSTTAVSESARSTGLPNSGKSAVNRDSSASSTSHSFAPALSAPSVAAPANPGLPISALESVFDR